MNPVTTAGLAVIGDEILSGKVRDTNTPFLIGQLRELGVGLRGIAVVPDVLGEIAATVRAFSERYDVVFTSGGVGPTHDDLTIQGVAQAFAVPVERHRDLERRMRGYYEQRGQPVLERNLRMAEVPRGAELLYADTLVWPVLVMRNVYILPGIPEIFERKFLAIRERFRSAPFHLWEIFVSAEEGVIAGHLDQVVAGHPRVALGSYPRRDAHPADGHRVRLTLESKDREAVARAFAELRERLAELVVRTTNGEGSE